MAPMPKKTVDVTKLKTSDILRFLSSRFEPEGLLYDDLNERHKVPEATRVADRDQLISQLEAEIDRRIPVP